MFINIYLKLITNPVLLLAGSQRIADLHIVVVE